MTNKIWSAEDIKRTIIKFENFIDLANRAGTNVDQVKDLVFRAIDKLKDNDLDEAGKHLIEARVKLGNALNGLKSWKKYWYFLLPIYGIRPAGYAVIWLIIAGYLLIFWSGSKAWLTSWLGPIQSLGVPAWAGLIATIGSSVQILISVVEDVKIYGYVKIHKRLWYFSLPFISAIFGFIAFICVQLGLLTIGNVRIVSSPSLLPLLICFLAGYATDWFMARLKTVLKA